MKLAVCTQADTRHPGAKPSWPVIMA